MVIVCDIFRREVAPDSCGGLKVIHLFSFCNMCGRNERSTPRTEPHCLGKTTDPGRSGKNNRLFIEAVLWIVRTGSPWRDLPALFGNWSTAFRRFRDWREADVFKRIFDALSQEPDMEYAMVDATIIKVHRHGQGAKAGLRARPLVVPKAE